MPHSPSYSEHWAKSMEVAHDEYMDRLRSGMDEYDITGEMFCGCTSCERRASWAFLMSQVLLAHQEGLIYLETQG